MKMKFKIIELEQKGNNLHVAVKHDKCERQVFSFPLEYYDNDRYIQEISKILVDRYIAISTKNIDKAKVNKEFDTQLELNEVKEEEKIAPREPKDVKK